MALRHGVACEHLDYIQIHPTTLYSHRKGRRFLISESVRGEGALLLDKNGNRFTNELQPRDVVSAAIRAQMEKDGTDHVWEDMRPIGEAAIREHFPNILERCEEEGYDPIHEPIPVVPAQHYFMGGITADLSSRTALPRLYACGETCCNGVHGRNRLAAIPCWNLWSLHSARQMIYYTENRLSLQAISPIWPHTVNRNRCLPRIGRRF